MLSDGACDSLVSVGFTIYAAYGKGDFVFEFQVDSNTSAWDFTDAVKMWCEVSVEDDCCA